MAPRVSLGVFLEEGDRLELSFWRPKPHVLPLDDPSVWLRGWELNPRLPGYGPGALPLGDPAISYGGIAGTRTLDICLAKAALSQLSYNPVLNGMAMGV